MIFEITKETIDYTLCESDEEKSVMQNLTLIMSTKQGSVPMYREFGIPMKFIDMPITAAKTVALSELTEAIELFEERAEIVSLEMSNSGGVLSPILKVRLRSENEE